MTIPYITPKQQEIPKLLYKFRFINRLQIQRLLNHKYHKRIIDWLNDLVEKEYLEKVPKGNTFEERTKLSVYRIGINGIRFLKTQEDCFPEIIQKLYRDDERSDNFINECILLADIYLTLQNNGHTVITSTDIINPQSPFHFLAELNPHLVYQENEKHKKKIYYLLEVFEPTLPRYSIRKRIRIYADFYFSNEWEDHMNSPFPIIRLICPTKAELIYAKRFTKKLLEENQNPEDFHIQFAVESEVNKFGVTEDIWEEVK